MVKVLSQAGMSLADVYDVEGSIAGVERLLAEDGISLVHEMGQTIFSERLSGHMRRSTTGAIIQSTAFNVLIGALPTGVTRLVGVQVYTDNQARVANCCLVLRDARQGREMPIWAWGTGDDFLNVEFEDNGGGVGTHSLLHSRPSVFTLPVVLVGGRQPQQVNELALRGASTAFGAGNVTINVTLYIAFTQLAGGSLSNWGLPVPSW